MGPIGATAELSGGDRWDRASYLGVRNCVKFCPVLLSQWLTGTYVCGFPCCSGVFCLRFVRGSVHSMKWDFKSRFSAASGHNPCHLSRDDINELKTMDHKTKVLCNMGRAVYLCSMPSVILCGRPAVGSSCLPGLIQQNQAQERQAAGSSLDPGILAFENPITSNRSASIDRLIMCCSICE